MTKPLVSICIPVFNGEKYLEQCLDSVLSQSFVNMEIIVVDDQSTDQSVGIIRKYLDKDPRMKLFINEKTRGLVQNWNRCLELAEGDWIKFIFQDDYMLPTCLEQMMNVAGSDVTFIAANRQFVFESNVSNSTREKYHQNRIQSEKLMDMNEEKFMNAKEISGIVAKSVDLNFIGEPSGVLFRKLVTEQIGYFNPLLVQLCDLEYWLRLSTNFGMYYIPKELVSFRIHEKSVSAGNRLSAIDSVDRIVLLNEFLHSTNYKTFRGSIPKRSLEKMWTMLKLRIHEMELALQKSQVDTKLAQHYALVKKEIPMIEKYQKATWFTKVIHGLVLLRRKIQS